MVIPQTLDTMADAAKSDVAAKRKASTMLAEGTIKLSKAPQSEAHKLLQKFLDELDGFKSGNENAEKDMDLAVVRAAILLGLATGPNGRRRRSV